MGERAPRCRGALAVIGAPRRVVPAVPLQQTINGRVRHGAAQHGFVSLPNRFDRDCLPVPASILECIQESLFLGKGEVLPPPSAPVRVQCLFVRRGRLEPAPQPADRGNRAAHHFGRLLQRQAIVVDEQYRLGGAQFRRGGRAPKQQPCPTHHLARVTRSIAHARCSRHKGPGDSISLIAGWRRLARLMLQHA
jgi:hypothetical protein